MSHLYVLVQDGRPQLHVFVQCADDRQILAFVFDAKIEDRQYCTCECVFSLLRTASQWSGMTSQSTLAHCMGLSCAHHAYSLF